jgi:GTPase SAR1 family protein
MLDGEGFLLVYSITERDSFKMIEAYHQQILRVRDTQAVPIIVVGNKGDLESERRVDMVGASHLNFHSTLRSDRTFDWRHVGTPAGNFCTTSTGGGTSNLSFHSVQHAEGQYIAEKLGCRFVETSAKLGSNVTETFIDLVCEIRDRNRVGFFFSFRSCLFFFLRLSSFFIFIIWDGSSTFCIFFLNLSVSPIP